MRVSAATISDLSVDVSYDTDIPPMPGKDELIALTRSELAEDIAWYKQRRDAEQAKGLPFKPYSRKLKRAEEKAKDFERIIAQDRPGFAIVPVYYGKSAKRRKTRRNPVFRDFDKKGRRRALINAAENHAEKLEKLGICDHGISMMRHGHHPLNREGRPYDVDIDHILDQVLYGRLGYLPVRDPDYTKDDAGPVYPVNAIGNLEVVTGEHHRDKNALTGMRRGPGWRLSIVPVRENDADGFVMAPQPGKEIKLRTHSHARSVSRFIFWTKRALNAVWNLRQNEEAQTLLDTFRQAAEKQGRPVAELAAGVGQENGGAALSGLFHAFSARFDQAPQGDADTPVRPALLELKEQAQSIVAESTADLWTPENDKRYAFFAATWRSRRVRALCETAAELPFAEAAELRLAFRVIDGKMEEADARRAAIARQKAENAREKSAYRETARARRAG